MIQPAIHAFATVTVGVLLSGCFSYVPSPAEAVPVGQDVRVTVTRVGASELAEVTRIDEEIPTLRGTVLDREAETLLLRVPVGQRQEGFHTVSLDQTIRVPLGEILQLERRELDIAKTSGIVGAAVAGSAFLIFSIMEAFGGDAGPGDPNPPQESRIPLRLFSVPVGR